MKRLSLRKMALIMIPYEVSLIELQNAVFGDQKEIRFG
jgi:hypothetical protein